jgi:hypothetical protein
MSLGKPVVFAIAGLLLVAMAAQIVLSLRQQSFTWDEGDHLFAGYMSLKKGDFALNPEHPPLAKMVAALPLLPLHLVVPPMEGRYFKDEAYFEGRELVFRNDPAHGGKYVGDELLFYARLSIMVFVLLLAVMVFLAGWEMFGAAGGLIALTLTVFEPNLLTNGGLVTTDAAVSCMFFTAVYAFYRYCKAPSAARLVVVGLAIGLALASKHSAILLPPTLVLLAVGELAGRWRAMRGSKESWLREVLRLVGAVTAMLAIGVFVLWACYGFRYAMRASGPIEIPTLLSTMRTLPALDNKVILFAVRWHLLPESYLFGLVDVRRVAGFQPTFFLGRIRQTGVWYYFPIVLLIKLTLPLLLLVATAAWAMVSGRVQQGREVWFLVAPPVIFLGFALTSPLNVGLRHVLPVVPFLLVLAAMGAVVLMRRRRGFVWVVGVLLIWNAVSCLRAYPNYMPYSNEAWGGPTKTRLYLTDSAVDWGQQLKATKAYLDAHNIHDCYFAYFIEPYIRFEDYGIPCKPLPTLETRSLFEADVPKVIHGTVLVSDSVLSGYELGSSVRNPYDSLFRRKPDDVIMNGVEVYREDFALPLARSVLYETRARKLLKTNPAASLVAATEAVEIAPQGFDAHLQRGYALSALGRKSEAVEEYRNVRAIAERMEPGTREKWEAKMDGLISKSRF